MKYILILLIQAGTGVTSVDRMALTSAEFDDYGACTNAIVEVRRVVNEKISGVCAPKSSAAPTAAKP